MDSIRPPRTHASGVGIDCDGAYALPGLADHHIHILALAAARNSVDCSPEAVKNRSALSRALHAAERDVHGWIRAIGYDQSTVGPLDVTVLDELAPAAPVRIQHRSGALWVLNSAALAQLDIRSAPAHAVERDHNGMPTGRIWRGDAWLQTQLPPAGELPSHVSERSSPVSGSPR
ncbi:amidohydrolase family protein [Leucobacter denitrificans]|uniref:Amidohydrolase family protein n=1 Tax=Leucobacter denitrificans TaxID=683042 RepID=A0A7G9S7I3_9MICO|nr:amidohydrolase family protein [Leucobacter denitrificans]